MKHIFQLLIRIYKTALSPMLPQSCRFYPTCSEYAHEAIGRHGVIRGGLMSIGRVCRCHPFNDGGHDPVP